MNTKITIKDLTVLKKLYSLTPVIMVAIGVTACSGNQPRQAATSSKTKAVVAHRAVPKATPIVYEKRSPKRYRKAARARSRTGYSRIPRSAFANKLSNAAMSRLRSRVRYDGRYVKIAYPWGDVPPNIGVCTDVVIRSYRKLGIDLQKEVHEDMSVAFNAYPNYRKWGLSRPDPNIDHRRVYNLRTFFARKGAALPVTRRASDYRPGDLVTWMVGPDLPHIGVVVNKRSRTDPNRFLIVHNIGSGPQIEDILFRFPITGHYRYTSANVRHTAPRTLYASRRPANRAMSQTDMANYGLLAAASNRLSKYNPSNSRVASKPVSSPQQSKSLVLANLSDVDVRQLLKK